MDWGSKIGYGSCWFDVEMTLDREWRKEIHIAKSPNIWDKDLVVAGGGDDVILNVVFLAQWEEQSLNFIFIL